jgi:hypothetical protein
MRESDDDIMYRLDEKPFGKAWSQWTVDWWKWVLSIPKSDNPSEDDTGKNFSRNQNDPDVLFLAGTKGGRVERKIVIPLGKSILLPVINFTTSFKEEPDLSTDSDLVRRAKSEIDDIVYKEAAIDGQRVQNLERFRVSSLPFDITFPENNIFELTAGKTRGISDGYWLFIKPLAPGNHNIFVSGSCLAGKISMAITYNVSVLE